VKALLAVLTLLASTAQAGEFFDDFSQPDLATLQAQGWKLREGPGHPGVAGSRFGREQLSLGQGLLRLTLKTDGDYARTQLAQLCAARKFLVGTTTARVRLRDTATPDPVVQSFFLAGPLRFDFDPEFSEVDFEYLPHGGWGSPARRLYGVAWQTVRLEPWLAYNHAVERFGSHDGWQLLTVQVEPGRTRHYVNGELLREAEGRTVPTVPMAISFSHWLAAGAQAGPAREHAFEVDWVLHVADRSLPPAEMEARVQQLRAQGLKQTDTVPDRGLTSECNL
jgi:hypothetical protein